MFRNPCAGDGSSLVNRANTRKLAAVGITLVSFLSCSFLASISASFFFNGVFIQRVALVVLILSSIFYLHQSPTSSWVRARSLVRAKKCGTVTVWYTCRTAREIGR